MQARIHATLSELREHAPFTFVGAAAGIVAMLAFARAPAEVSHRLFQVFHPSHVILSAIVTASLFKLHEKTRGFLIVLVVGYLGSVGVATLSDSILPFFGESLLGVAVPIHADVHGHADAPGREAVQGPSDDHAAARDAGQAAPSVSSADAGRRVARSQEPAHRPRVYFGFIEDWYLVNPAAILGVLIAWFWPHSKFPHAGHILVSTWASSFHVLMNTQRELSAVMLLGVFIVLFISVWLPCCASDIIFPMLFVRSPHLHAGCQHSTEVSP